MQVTSCAALHNIGGSTSEAANKSRAFYFHNKHLATKELEICTNEFHVSAFTEWSSSPFMYGSVEPMKIFTVSVSFQLPSCLYIPGLHYVSIYFNLAWLVSQTLQFQGGFSLLLSVIYIGGNLCVEFMKKILARHCTANKFNNVFLSWNIFLVIDPFLLL